MLADYLLVFFRVTIGLLFLISATGKLRDTAAFQEAVVDFQLLPRSWSRAVALGVPGAELCVVLLVAAGGPLLLVGFALAAALLLVFSTALVTVLRRDFTVTCNCFGPTVRRVSIYDVIRNAILIACALLGIWTLLEPRRGLPGTEVILVVLMASCFVVPLIHLSDVVETLRRPFKALEDSDEHDLPVG
jgi:hypothetical protein